jgi:hypothetical protein
MSNARKAYRGKELKQREAREHGRRGISRNSAISLTIAIMLGAWIVMIITGVIPT